MHAGFISTLQVLIECAIRRRRVLQWLSCVYSLLASRDLCHHWSRYFQQRTCIMTKTKNPGAGAVKAPKPAAAKPGVVKPFSKAAAKPGLSKPVSKGNQNSTCAQATSTFEQAGKKRARSPEASEAEPGRRKRREPARSVAERFTPANSA